MKKSNQKFLALFTVIAIGTFLWLEPMGNRTDLAKNEIKKQTKGIQDITKAVDQNIARKPASIPTVPSKKDPNKRREVIGKFANLGDVRIINEESDNWKDKYQHNFLRMLGDQKVEDFQVKLKRSILKVEDNIGRQLEHIIVSYKKPNGDPFSFEALVDSTTGQTVQTWNQTRYEFKKSVKLKGHGHKFYNN